jgi:hypothetical protein
MTTSHRFSFDGENVIDTLNPTNSRRTRLHISDPENEVRIRESLLWTLLSGLVDKLIINLRPTQKRLDGEVYQPLNEEGDAICWALYGAIKASQLNSFNPTISIQHKFDGALKRAKKGTADFTSLSLFRDDVEYLLRDLYGDVESEALDNVLRAVSLIVESFTKYVCTDLWEEHSEARTLDCNVFGIGLPDGYGISGSMVGRGRAAIDALTLRSRDVLANRSAFSDYTVAFAKQFFSNPWGLRLNRKRSHGQRILNGPPE